MNFHHLNGCAPTPLAHYLKALGILRLVTQQADAEARGWWNGDRFVLATDLSHQDLINFFLLQYEPTPLISPWLKGSGFYNAADPALNASAHSTAVRFESLRKGIEAGRALLAQISIADQEVRKIKGEAKGEMTRVQKVSLRSSDPYKKRLAAAEREFRLLKADLIPNLRLEWRGQHREWLDAALVLESEGSVRYPALLGTGGNDGRLDFTNNYFQRIGDLFDLTSADGAPRSEASAWFEQALFGDPAKVLKEGVAVGQFEPSGSGGANAANGPEASSQLNPVDFVLMLEGSVAFTSGIAKRLDSQQPGRAAAPFAIGGQSAGYASASESDASARGEQWMPLWGQPLTMQELHHLLAEGRAQLGGRQAQEPLDLARAVARLGSARGIAAFQRYAFIERNGQSNLAVPIGRFVVADHTSPLLDCLDDLDPWLPRFRREARSKGVPVRLTSTERQLADSLLAVTQAPNQPIRWQTVLRRLADIEAIQITGSGFKAGPIPRLRPEWILAADDGSAEFRLALAFALQAAGFNRDSTPSDGIRRNWLPLDGNRFAVSGSGAQTRLMVGPDCVLQGRNGIEDAIELVTRRLIEGAQRGERRLPLMADPAAAALGSDIAHFLSGDVDADRTLQLARALMALDRRVWAKAKVHTKRPPFDGSPDDAWIAIRLAMLPFPIRAGLHVGTDPAIFRRISSGDTASAVQLALRRLRSAGINSAVRIATSPARDTKRWAAALAFPISQTTAAVFLKRLDPNLSEETK